MLARDFSVQFTTLKNENEWLRLMPQPVYRYKSEDDNIVEATAANVFLVSKGTLLTPELSHCGVEGVMREAVLDVARHLTLPCRVEPVSHATLDKVDEVFLTNSLIGIWPVTQVQSKAFAVGPTTRRLQETIMRMPYIGDTA